MPEQARGQRLDRCLARHADLARNQVRRWFDEGRVWIDGKAVKPSFVLGGDEWLEWEPQEPAPEEGLEPEAGELVVLYEDEDVVVLDKPAGILVHPGAGRRHGTLAQLLLSRYPEVAAVGSPRRPGIVHRLDEGTTGVLVIARSPRAYRSLCADFAAHDVRKTYLAVVYGAPDPATGAIDLPVGRHPRDRKRMTVRPDGRPATTRYRSLATVEGISVLEMDLLTGRTHQIRVHLKRLGHPLVGDPVYGEARWKGLASRLQPPLRSFARPALHAWRLGLRHPASGTPVHFEAPVPEDLRRLWHRVSSSPFPGHGDSGQEERTESL